jgi:hypothetical protein
MDTLLSAALAKTSFGAKSFVGDFYFFFGNFVGDFSLEVGCSFRRFLSARRRPVEDSRGRPCGGYAILWRVPEFRS